MIREVLPIGELVVKPRQGDLSATLSTRSLLCRSASLLSRRSVYLRNLISGQKAETSLLKLPKLRKTDNYCHKKIATYISEKSLISYFSAVWAVGRPSLHQCQPQQRQLHRSRLLQLRSRKCLQFSTVTGGMAFIIVKQALLG